MFKKTLHLTITLLFTLSIGATLLKNDVVEAVTSSDWQAGRIIDDYVFTNKDSMGVDQIQAFLNSKVGTGGYASIPGQCDSEGALSAAPYSSSTRTQYGAFRNPSNPKFTCLKDYYEVPKTSPGAGVPANNYGGKPIPAGAKSAAQLIWDAAQTYNISPKVLLVTIQKESAGPLTTDDWPFEKQYTYAMGAYCPDSGPGGSANCDPNYAGFSIQISESAKLFRNYLDNMDKPWTPSWWKKPYQNNYVLWQIAPSGCGGSNVYIANKATAALYIYTPYQPNQAALNNLYGTGDPCSAYGNRNFWRIYSDWFGSTYNATFSAQYRAQSEYPYIMTGESKNIYVQFTNTGTAFWKDDVSTFPGYPAIHLATTSPINRSSDFRSSNWLSPSRPNGTFTKVLEGDGYNMSPDQHTVRPGQIGEWQFTLSVPLDYSGGVYREYFQPIAEGTPGYAMGAWTYIDVYVVKSTHTAQYKTQSAYPTIKVGDKSNVFVEFKNIGNANWQDDTTVGPGKKPVHLATTGPVNRNSVFSSDWPSIGRPSNNFSKVFEADGVTLAADQHTVQPGQIGRFDFTLSTQNIPPGTYREYFQPILEGSSGWDMGVVTYLDVTVIPSKFSAAYSAQSPYPTLSRGQTTQAFFRYKNTGNNFWKDDSSNFPGYKPTHLATTGPINRISSFRNPSWSTTSRPSNNFSKVFEADGVTLAADQYTVQPGQIGEFSFTISVPINMATGNHREYFQPILEGASSWDLGVVTYLDILVI